MPAGVGGFISFHIFSNLYAENKGLANKLLRVMKKAWLELKNLVNSLSGDGLSDEALAVRRMSNNSKKLLAQKYAEALKVVRGEYTSTNTDKAETVEKSGENDNAVDINKNTTENGGEKFQIRMDADGNKYVKVDESIYDNTDGTSVASVIANIISTRFNNLIEANGQKIQINKTTNDEWVKSKSAQYLLKREPQKVFDKYKAISNADELLKVANNWIGEEIKHSRNDDIVEFARGDISYKVGNNGYIADIIVGIRKNGNAVLYDLKNIYDKKITEFRSTATENRLRTRENSVIGNSIPTSTEKVNNSSENSNNFKKQSRDTEYLELAKNPEQNEARLRVLVDEAAKKAGYIVEAYHGTGRAYYSVTSNEIVINKSEFNTLSNKGLKNLLIHEIQHAVQTIEGFTGGASTDDFAAYLNTAGEIEAYDVGDRADMTAEQRKNTRPDIDRTDVVFAENGVSYYYEGKTEDGRSIYHTNYGIGTPKAVKQNDLIDLVQNVWSKSPIKLNVIENNEIKEIKASFNPELTERSDLSKIAFGNRKGTGSEKRITNNLFSDFYQIASESKYVGSKDEIGKTNEAHKGVTNGITLLPILFMKRMTARE